VNHARGNENFNKKERQKGKGGRELVRIIKRGSGRCIEEGRRIAMGVGPKNATKGQKITVRIRGCGNFYRNQGGKKGKRND